MFDDGSRRHLLVATLTAIVGRRHVLTSSSATRRYRQGFRTPAGNTAVVARPGSLLEYWRVLQACVSADAALIVQAANTGLTGGSTPASKGYDRPLVIVSVTRLKGIMPVDGARQVVCLPGATLNALEQKLRPLGREPHSVIGSSCFGASVIGGICNNSGGSLVQRGPAYTEYALYAQSTPSGGLELVNHLGIDLGTQAEDMLARLDAGELPSDCLRDDRRRASDSGYVDHVRDIEADTPARHNADPRCLHEASGCAGKLAVFAVRLDSFPLERDSKTFYIGSSAPERLADLRRRILTHCETLPIAAEYLHSEAFDLADRYGKDQFLLIRRLGTDRLPLFFALKGRIDALLSRWRWLPEGLADRLLYRAGRLWGDHLPRRMREWRRQFDHHLMVKTSAASAPALLTLLRDWAVGGDDLFECTPDEAERAFLHRFVVAGAAVRYQAIHARQGVQLLALDIALRRNDGAWFETLSNEIDAQLVHRVYYGHFLCHVLHQDYVLSPGADANAVKAAMLAQLDRRGARYPAEHNVGHLYKAAAPLADFYRALDPANRFNPGIGGTSRLRNHGTDA